MIEITTIYDLNSPLFYNFVRILDIHMITIQTREICQTNFFRNMTNKRDDGIRCAHLTSF